MLNIFTKTALNLLVFLLLVFTSFTVRAEDKHIFKSDPIYQKLADEDSHPMDDMKDLIKEGNTRAMFIVGDLYSKGKGGLPLDLNKAREYFETAAKYGYEYAFIRLAALEKRAENYPKAWKWYTIAIRKFEHGEFRNSIIKLRNELVDEYNVNRNDIRAMTRAVDEWEVVTKEALRLERIEFFRKQKEAEKKAEKKRSKQDQKPVTPVVEKKIEDVEVVEVRLEAKSEEVIESAIIEAKDVVEVENNKETEINKDIVESTIEVESKKEVEDEVKTKSIVEVINEVADDIIPEGLSEDEKEIVIPE